MTAEATRARFPYGLTVVCILALALLCWLGTWQVQRMQWKNGLIDQAEAAAGLPPAPIASVMALDDPAFRKVAIDCPGLAGTFQRQSNVCPMRSPNLLGCRIQVVSGGRRRIDMGHYIA